MIQKISCLSTKVNRPFYHMVKIRVIIIQNVNIFTIYGTLFENVITSSQITCQNKTKMAGKKQEVPGLFIRSGKLYQLHTS